MKFSEFCELCQKGEMHDLLMHKKMTLGSLENCKFLGTNPRTCMLVELLHKSAIDEYTEGAFDYGIRALLKCESWGNKLYCSDYNNLADNEVVMLAQDISNSACLISEILEIRTIISREIYPEIFEMSPGEMLCMPPKQLVALYVRCEQLSEKV